MKKLRKRMLVLLVVLSMFFVGTPVTAETPTADVETPKQYIYPVGSCSPTDSELYCVFTIDMNAMQRYTDSVIPLDFAIMGAEAEEEYTVEIDTTVDITHNISETDVFTKECNEISLRITVCEERVQQSLESLVYEYIIINLCNKNSKIEYTIEMCFINTQYGLFVGYINEEGLFDQYGLWLLEKGYITNMRYTSIVDEAHTAKPNNINKSEIQTYAATTYTASTMYVTYTISGVSSGAYLDVYGYVYWIDTGGNQQRARYVEIDICDKEIVGYEKLGSCITNANGYYYLRVENQTGLFENGGCDISIKVFAKTRYAEMVNSLAAQHYFYIDCGDNFSGYHSGAQQYGVDDVSESFCLLDAITTGALYTTAMSGATPDQVTVRYPWSGALTNHYNPVNGNIHILEESGTSWDIVLHEYGHYVSDVYGIYPFIAMDHDPSQNLITYAYENWVSLQPKYDGCALAWQEGWATYFSVSSQIQQSAQNLTIDGVGNLFFNYQSIEVNDSTDYEKRSKGEAHEFAVARALWDMADIQGTTYGASDGDLIGFGFATVWKYSVESGADTFSKFMQSVYSRYINTSTIYRNLGHLMEDHDIAAELLTTPATLDQITINWEPAYTGNHVANSYYLEIYDLNMVILHRASLGTISTVNGVSGISYTLSGDVWNIICTQFGSGIYIRIKTVPQELDHATGPYYSYTRKLIPNTF